MRCILVPTKSCLQQDAVNNNRGEGEGEGDGGGLQPKVEAIQLNTGDVNDAIQQQAVIQQLLQLSEQVTGDMEAGAAAKSAGGQVRKAQCVRWTAGLCETEKIRTLYFREF